MKIFIKIFLIFAAMLALSLVSCSHDEHKEHKLGNFMATKPLVLDTIITNEYVSQIHAINRIELRALEKGYIQKIFVDEGQTIRKGQKMFKIMPNIYEADLKIMKAEVDIAQIEYNNTKALSDKNVVSKNELLLAQAKLDKAKAELELAQTHLGFTDINAPFEGIMDHFHVREGSLVDEGELLTTLSDNSKMWIYFNVPESQYLSYISTKKSSEDEIVELRMANGEIFGSKGKIETIEGEFNNETGNIQFRATFPNNDRILRHGQTGNVILKNKVKNAILIPQKATFEVLDKRYVFIIDKYNTIKQKEISVSSDEIPHLFIVTKGLTVNDKILIEGLRKVHDGDKIKVKYQEPSKVYNNLELFAE